MIFNVLVTRNRSRGVRLSCTSYKVHVAYALCVLCAPLNVHMHMLFGHAPPHYMYIRISINTIWVLAVCPETMRCIAASSSPRPVVADTTMCLLINFKHVQQSCNLLFRLLGLSMYTSAKHESSNFLETLISPIDSNN